MPNNDDDDDGAVASNKHADIAWRLMNLWHLFLNYDEAQHY